MSDAIPVTATLEDYKSYVTKQMDLKALVSEIAPIKKELESFPLPIPPSDMSSFDDEFMHLSKVIERVAVIHSDYSLINNRYLRFMKGLVLVRKRQEDIVALKENDTNKKVYAEFDLAPFTKIRDHLEFIVEKSALIKEVYEQRYKTLSRMQSFLEYKSKIK